MNNFVELIKCQEDFYYFLKHVRIVHYKKGLVPFDLYDYHRRVAAAYDRERFVIVKKFRQGAFTTFTVLWLLWRCLFHAKQKVMVLTKSNREAISFGKMVRDILKNLPEWLQPRLSRDNDHEKYFVMTDSSMEFWTPSAARSKSLTHLFIDEPAFIKNMDEHWKSMYPTLSTGGSCIAVSTVNGLGNWFSETYLDAQEGKNAFHCVEVDYYENPEYNDAQWVATMRENLGEIGFRQEILGEFLGMETPEVEQMAMDHAVKMSNEQLGIHLRSVAYRVKKRDLDGYACLIEAWKRLIQVHK